MMAATINQTYGRLVSLSLPCEGFSALDFLTSAHGKSRYYWRYGEMTLAGVGTALEITAIGQNQVSDIRAQVLDLFQNAAIHSDHPLAEPRLFGGLSFFPDFVPDHIWSIYFPAHFVLPHYQFLRIQNRQWLTINIQMPMEDSPNFDDLQAALSEKIAELCAEKAQLGEIAATVQAVNYPMPFETWAENIQKILASIQAQEIQKVVLARACEMRFQHPPNLLAALDYLGEVYPECYRFLFEPRAGFGFLGATPELLVRTQGQQFETMGLAGSIQRGKTPAEDAEFAQALRDSPKDQWEHQVVVDTILENLQPHTHSLEVGQTDVLTLSNIQHLHTPLQGKLNPAEDVLSLVEVLHPTPAMGGKPRQQALQMIRNLESVPRGWYAAPIGWLDGHLNGEFGVAIRSAVVEDQRVWLYAGVGVVAGSDPQKEWDETNLKFRPMLNALTRSAS